MQAIFCLIIKLTLHKYVNNSLVQGFFQGVLGTRFRSLELEKMIIGCLEF